jgi:hypothetical protein
MTGQDAVAHEALFLNGTVGAGKTTTADEIGSLLRQHDLPHAIIDLDWLRNAWPSPVDDPFHQDLELANLTAVATNFRRAGAQRLVLAGVIESVADRRRYARALAVPLTVCRLVVPLPRLRSRITGRHSAGPERDWHLGRTGELHAILEAAQVDDVIVAVDDQEPASVAAEVLQAVLWI